MTPNKKSIICFTVLDNKSRTLTFNQNDSNVCEIEFSVYQDSLTNKETGITSAVINIDPPSSESISYGMDNITIIDNVITFVLPPTALASAGNGYNGELFIYGTDYQRRTICKFKYNVRAEIIFDNPIQDDEHYPVLTALINQTQNLYDEALNLSVENATAEVVAARMGEDDLPTKIGKVDSYLAEKANQSDLDTTDANVTTNANAISTKAEKTYVDTNKRDKSVLIGLNDLGNDAVSAITGGTTANILSIPKFNSVDHWRTNFLVTGNNLFDKTDPEITDGYYLSQTGVKTANASLFVSGKIPVTANQVFSEPYINLIGDTTCGCYYNNNDQLITYVTGVTQSGNTSRLITVPNDTSISYMKLNLRSLFKDTSMVVLGSTYPSTYSAFAVTFSNSYGLNETQKSQVSSLAGGNPLAGKIITGNGDSIYYGVGFAGGFAKIITDRNGMTNENIAVSGATITPGQYQSDGITLRHCISTSIANMRSDAQYIILEGGVNDASLAVPMGTLTGNFDFTSTLNTATFCGAFENMLKQAIARYPGKKIGFVITHKMLSAFDAYYNNMITALQKWGIPYCDLYKGIPSLNYIDYLKTTYTNNADGWHPNQQGYLQFYCDKIESWMKTL